eukprot:759045-Hanusia_phi.AAC.1
MAAMMAYMKLKTERSKEIKYEELIRSCCEADVFHRFPFAFALRLPNPFQLGKFTTRPGTVEPILDIYPRAVSRPRPPYDSRRNFGIHGRRAVPETSNHHV